MQLARDLPYFGCEFAQQILRCEAGEEPGSLRFGMTEIVVSTR